MAGQSYFEQGRFDDAGQQFQEAYRLSPRPALLLNASMAYERAMRYELAAQLLEQYLASGAPEVEPQRTTLTTKLDQLRGLASEQEAQRRAVEEARAAAARAQAEAEAAREAGGQPAREEGAPASPSPAGMGGLGIAGLSVGGAGAALGIVALATGLVANSRYKDLEDSCGPDLRCPPELQDELDSGRRLALTSTVTTFVAIGAVGGGLTMFLLDRRSRRTRDTQVAFGFGPREAALTARWRY